jgi:peptidoglycan/xylan/chitin deacetylase (PgdA/CDA1 family)
VIESQVINICFHGIGTPNRDLEPGEASYWVGGDQYRSILDEIAGWPSVHISFDDGNDSDVTIGLPEICKRGLTATFFPLAGRLGGAGSLSAEDVGEIASHGMTVGTHGMAHRSWRGMDPVTREVELVTARQLLADAAGAPVTEAACPLGRYDRRLLSLLRELEYRHVYTSDRRMASARAWLQPRFSVRSQDTVETLRERILARPGMTKRAWRGAAKVRQRLR